MATGLLYYDGFEDTTTESDYWGTAGTRPTITSGGRTGAFHLHIGTISHHMWRELGASYADTIVGFAYRNGTSGQAKCIMGWYDGTTQHITMSVSTADKLTFRRGLTGADSGGTLLQTSTTTLTSDVWYWIEVRVAVNNTTGIIHLKVNTVDDFNITSQDTQNGGAASASRIQIGFNAGGATAIDHDIDDIYILDRSVGAGFLGNKRVDTFYPDGAGDNTDFTPSAGNNWENVDEVNPDNDTTYNESSTTGHKDLFTLLDTPTSATGIVGVAHIYKVRMTDAGPRTVRGLLKHSSNTTNQTTRNQDVSYLSYFQHNEDCPGSTGWTKAQVDALQAGYEVVS